MYIYPNASVPVQEIRMIATLNFPPNRMSLCSGKKSTNKNKSRKHSRWGTKERRNALSFPKPKSTPLLIRHRPRTQTKFEALEQVVKDLEASVEKGIRIDPEIYASLLETCYHLEAIHHGIRVHRLIPSSLLHRNVGISSKLLRLYASCGYMDEAHDLFDQMAKRDTSAFPWNSLISGYAQVGFYDDAIALYFQMVEEGVEPDLFTFPRVLKACAGIGSVQVGEEVHRHVVRSGFANDGFVLNALVDMYSKCGDIVKARKIFNKMPHRDSVSWNSMLVAYVHHGLEVETMNIFRFMHLAGYKPDSITISTILTGVSSLYLGVQIHGWVIRQGLEWNLSIANSLIMMYSNHGRLDKACWIFNLMPERDVVSWNSIISAYCKHREALAYFERMKEAGVEPDKITFVSLLSACAYSGLVKDGERLFALMCEKYEIKPIMEHYGCMVNLYGRAGLIKKAYSIIVEGMDSEVAGPTLWGALLYACSLHGDVAIGEIAASKLFDLEPDNEQNFVLLMRIYENAGRLDDMERVRMMLVDRGLDY
ncbi:pentatricopeptide repeat-containing protein At4g25270, chloroplastic [Abrus precatorius]|uniref:Pentatricopeptide repeat-containing protein At4g25270, chloroplastic n=1 Tax=Abrus precatorius TaxID=3816 RepID=A0A8B8LKU9_ABRPR|nr:pentatricopeptide repeat-containing protein At4g25270, chloroplastic [Abrus precatorius]